VDLGLDRAGLAVLGREWLLHGHLQDRVGMALVLEHTSREQMQEVAIEEWMAASPVYSRRMQRAMRFGGDGVDTIMKNLQLDIGAPHEFMDFRYRLIDRNHGEFWLAHCGALMDVEPMGTEFVHGMCHTIEDPTFDATAGATNPRARVRPLHRPPRVPAGRTPHCHWRIDITASDQLVEPHPNQSLVAECRLARLPVQTAEASEPGAGRDDYRGAFDPEFRLEQLSAAALGVVLREVAIQSHLLLRSFLLSVTQRLGSEVAAATVPRLVAGWGGLTARRLRDALNLSPDAAGLATMLRLHPMLHPSDYIAVDIDVVDEQAVRLAFRDCEAAHEDDRLTWFAFLGASADAALEHAVQGFDPRARLVPESARGRALHRYRITLDPAAPPAAAAPELGLAMVSTGADFRFTRGRVLPLAGDLA
jgi:hypothetical protein